MDISTNNKDGKNSLDAVIGELRRLNMSVPKPMGLPSMREVQKAKKQLGIRFHKDFIKYLLEASDISFGFVEPVTLSSPSCHTHLITIAHDAWKMGVPKDLLPVCEDNGDYYCMDQNGQILFWSHNGLSNERWPDLATWIKNVWVEGN